MACVHVGCGLCSILSHLLPGIVHRYVNKVKDACPVYNEFVVPVINPVEDGYDLRGLKCRYVSRVF